METRDAMQIVRQALDILTPALREFTTRELKHCLGDGWLEQVRPSLRDDRQGRVRGPEDLDLTDLISPICHGGDYVPHQAFKGRPDYDFVSGDLKEVQKWRNMVSHDTGPNRRQVAHGVVQAVDSCARVLEWIGEPHLSAGLRPRLPVIPQDGVSLVDLTPSSWLALFALMRMGEGAAPAAGTLFQWYYDLHPEDFDFLLSRDEDVANGKGLYLVASEVLDSIGPAAAPAFGAFLLGCDEVERCCEASNLLRRLAAPLPGIAAGLPAVISVIAKWVPKALSEGCGRDVLRNLGSALADHSLPAVRALKVIAGIAPPGDERIDSSVLLYDIYGLRHSPDEAYTSLLEAVLTDLPEGETLTVPPLYAWRPEERAGCLLRRIKSACASAIPVLQEARTKVQDNEDLGALLWQLEGILGQVEEAARTPDEARDEGPLPPAQDGTRP
jgi:hypothetical protein